ncbi:MAG TPA: glycosyltransferase [Ideonella sp.]|jgi:lipopolysaccharide biosynthesis glycosyltransferase|nr:glycosyltransferase [Ideonella sp.]
MKTTSTVDTVAQLIDELRSMKTPTEVLAAAQDGLRQFGPHGLPHFFAGRALVQLGRPDEAIVHLEQSRQLTPKHHWAAYELARALALAGRPEQAVEALAQFMNQHAQPLGHLQVDWAQKILDRAFESGSRAGIAALYRRLLELGDARYLTVLRAFEGAMEANDLETAGRLLSQLGSPRDAWSHLAVARYHSKLAGHEAQTKEHALCAAEALPDHPMVALAAAELLSRTSDHAVLRERIERWSGRLPAEDTALLRLVAAARDAAIVPDLPLACRSAHAHRWHFIPYLYAAAQRLPDDRAALYEALLQRFPNDGDLLLCITNLEVGRRNFDEARRFCDQGLAANAEARLNSEFHFKLFELACFTHDLEEAARRLGEVSVSALDSMQRAAVARYHAECGQWRDAMDVLRPLLADAPRLSPEHALLIVRVARQVKGQQEVLAALPLGATGSDMGAYVAGALFEDWVLAEDTAVGDAATTAQALDLAVSPLLAFKLGTLAPAKHAVLSKPVHGTASMRRDVFFCADRAYVMPALVSLCSLLMHNPGFADARFHVVVDDELIGVASEATDRIGRHFGAAVRPQPASELMPDSSRLASGYGLFTGGQQLAVAAYYRIYMARLLAERGEADQILYIDSDTLIGPGFDGLLNEPVKEGAMLMARLEVDRPEVRQAIARHGLLPGMYFNSGVLWFPRRDEALLERLNRSVEAAEQRSSELLFQDQCALNIGFAGAIAPLAERYNFFAGPHDEPKLLATPTAEVSMLHVLDRPKPWDSAYPRGSSIQRRWLSAAHALRRIIGLSTLEPLLAHTLR